ncbi:MAG: TonB-dependent receptor plug domain-containing protein [Deltaproteobacteria bacterium]|nr:TonB-dependent receptor plug domain-containing protein [Deltaproteobacteria bacterium]
MDLSVFSPAKKLQKLKNVPSAIYVMTSEDIRRSAATTLIDLFRLVPGIEVARVSAHEWAITARGFNQVFGNKILLLIDGAPVETPIFNGILWENINHEVGARNGIVKAVRNYINVHDLQPKGVKIIAEDIREGIICLVSVKLPSSEFSPQFQ